MPVRDIIRTKKTEAETMRGIKNLVGIFGYPIGHTLSPAMHNEAFRTLGLNDWYYDSFEVPPEELKEATDAIRELNIRGVNITIPHKEKIIPLLNEVDENAKAIGAVNTVKNSDGNLAGYNTDMPGFIRALQDEGFSPEGKNALVVGAGGAACAVVYALLTNRAGRIFIYDIIRGKSRNLAEKFNIEEITAESFTDDIPKDLDLIVNASPVGMKPNDPLPGILSERFLSRLSEVKNAAGNILIYDLVYNRKTQLLITAEKLGFKAAGGLGMLLHQGAVAFKLWTGKDAPIKKMLEVIVGKSSITD